MEDKEFAEAWAKEANDEAKNDPLVESIKAARKAADDEFEDAFKNDKFGLDVEAAAKKDEKSEKTEAENA